MGKNEALREMLMELDRQFDRDTAAGGVKAWASYFAEDGVMVVAKDEDIKGRESIHKHMARAFSLPGFSLRWEPIDSRISEDGSLGYTYGKYIRKYLDDKGIEITFTGKYTSIWQKQSETDWRIVLDIGN